MDLRGYDRNNFRALSFSLPSYVSLTARIAIALTIASLVYGAAGATSAPSKKQDCTWGTSSVAAWVAANGTVHQSEPVTTGCVP